MAIKAYGKKQMAQNRRSKQESPGTAQGERNSKTTEQR